MGVGGLTETISWHQHKFTKSFGVTTSVFFTQKRFSWKSLSGSGRDLFKGKNPLTNPYQKHGAAIQPQQTCYYCFSAVVAAVSCYVSLTVSRFGDSWSLQTWWTQSPKLPPAWLHPYPAKIGHMCTTVPQHASSIWSVCGSFTLHPFQQNSSNSNDSRTLCTYAGANRIYSLIWRCYSSITWKGQLS